MSIFLSSLAVTIAALALKESVSNKQVEIHYVVKKAVNPPLPPLPVESKPALPYFLNKVNGGYPYVN